MQDDTQSVPQWFTNFAIKNADEHGRLAAEIARAETRSTRWMIGTMIGATTLIITAMTIIVG